MELQKLEEMREREKKGGGLFPILESHPILYFLILNAFCLGKKVLAWLDAGDCENPPANKLGSLKLRRMYLLMFLPWLLGTASCSI